MLYDKFPSFDDHVYAYVRVSTDKQDIESQLNEVFNYCIKERLYPPQKNVFQDEAISGKVTWKNRKINDIMEKIKKGDILILPELSRAGRNLNEVNEIIAICDRKGCLIIDIKNKIKLDGSIQSKIMGNLYGLFTEIERNIISERVKQGLVVAKMKGNLTGRKRGIKKNKLDGKEEEIKKLLDEGETKKYISKYLDVDYAQLHRFIEKREILKK